MPNTDNNELSSSKYNATTATTDRYGRTMRYLRVSVTDRCNHKCNYCTTGDDIHKERTDILSFDEITHVIRVLAKHGINKIRLTGGEPLVRKGITELVKMISSVGGIEDLTMTTNASLLARHARELKQAGLNRINISLDTLDPEKFKEITGGAELTPVLEGIEAAIKEDLTPIKINAVIMRGVNDDELATLIDFASERDITMRFIECMPMSGGLIWKDTYLSIEDVLKRGDIKERVDTTAAPETHKTAAYTLPLSSGKGKVGFVSPMSNRFCYDCNRLRLTSDGKIRACLPTDSDVDIKAALRSGKNPVEIDKEIIALVKKAVLLKPETGEYTYNDDERDRSMIHIGG